MYDVLTVSRFIINYSNEKKYGISNLRLQKLLYFVQAVFLCEEKTECFNEDILAWDFGPVVNEAYQEFKMYGSSNIPTITHFYDFSNGDIWSLKKVPFDDSVITSDHKTIIMQVVDDLSKYSTTTLVSITHNQKPWVDAYRKGQNTRIDNDAIRGYFDE